MKSIAKRTGFALVLACILLFGVLTFVIRYFLYAERWVSFTGSPHVYTNGRLDTGEILPGSFSKYGAAYTRTLDEKKHSFSMIEGGERHVVNL